MLSLPKKLTNTALFAHNKPHHYNEGIILSLEGRGFIPLVCSFLEILGKFHYILTAMAM